MPSTRLKPPRLTLSQTHRTGTRTPHSPAEAQGSPRRGLTGAEISTVGKCPADRQKRRPGVALPEPPCPLPLPPEPGAPGRLPYLPVSTGSLRLRAVIAAPSPRARGGAPDPGPSRARPPRGRPAPTRLLAARAERACFNWWSLPGS